MLKEQDSWEESANWNPSTRTIPYSEFFIFFYSLLALLNFSCGTKYTAIPSERLFSNVSDIYNEKSPENAETLLLLKIDKSLNNILFTIM